MSEEFNAIQRLMDIRNRITALQKELQEARTKPGLDHYADLQEFHSKFELVTVHYPHVLPAQDMLPRINGMQEELHEFCVAYASYINATTPDAEEACCVAMLDALIDLTYFAIGTAELMKMPWNEAWAAVHASNMTREKVPSAKRGGHYDILKGKDYRPPMLGMILAEARDKG